MRFQDNNHKNPNFSNPSKLWISFAKQGRIEDYLRYRGIDIYTNNSNLASYLQAKNSVVPPPAAEDEREHSKDGDKRSGNQGKQ